MIPGLAQWVKDPSGIAMSCGERRRRGSDPMLLWLWRRPAAVALIRPLAWEPPYTVHAALKSKKAKKNAASPHPLHLPGPKPPSFLACPSHLALAGLGFHLFSAQQRE